jgi:hypothetical protein
MHKLGMVEDGTFGDGAVINPATETTYRYRVTGLPQGEEASIANFEGGWQILRISHGKQGHWYDKHETADAALAALEAQIG